MIKKQIYFIVALVLVLALAFSACSNVQNNTPDSGDNSNSNINDDSNNIGDNSDNENGKQTPIYTGMTVSNYVAQSAATNGNINNNGNGNNNGNNGNHYGNYKGDYEGKDDSVDKDNPFPENGDNANIEEEIDSSLGIIGSGKDIYYSPVGEDIYISVHLSNPDKFEILSFTLNGEKYSSYMFERGSNLETLILKVNVGLVSGIKEYTIDAIKYVDGDSIKDVTIAGDKTVSVGVSTEKQVVSNVSNFVINTNSVSLNVEIIDKDNLIDFFGGEAKIFLYDGEIIVDEQKLSIGMNDISFDGLKTDTVYQLAVVACYDNLLGEGFGAYIFYKDAFCTDSVVLFNNIVISQERISFGYIWHRDHREKSITSLKLYKDGVLLRELSADALSVTDLLSANTYTLVAEYENLGKIESIYLEFTTYSKSVPGISLSVVDKTYDSVEFAINETDPDSIGDIVKIELIHKDGTIVADSVDAREFTGLHSGNEYTIKVTYVYDLGDGNGEKEIIIDCNVKTAEFSVTPYSNYNIENCQDFKDNSVDNCINAIGIGNYGNSPFVTIGKTNENLDNSLLAYCNTTTNSIESYNNNLFINALTKNSEPFTVVGDGAKAYYVIDFDVATYGNMLPGFDIVVLMRNASTGYGFPFSEELFIGNYITGIDEWVHVTIVGDIANNVAKIYVNGIYVADVGSAVRSDRLDPGETQVVAQGFRIEFTRNNTQPDMTLGDNVTFDNLSYRLYTNGNDTLKAFVEYGDLSEWEDNLTGRSGEKLHVIATVNGVEYRNTASLEEAINSGSNPEIEFFAQPISPVCIEKNALINTQGMDIHKLIDLTCCSITSTEGDYVTVKIVPTILLESSNITETSFNLTSTLRDPVGVCSIIEVNLIGPDKTSKYEYSEMLVFENLIANGTYQVEIKYSYDLGNGDGIQYASSSISVNLTTYFSYTSVENKEITITGFTGSNIPDTLVIPEYIHGNKVVAIGDGAFRDCVNIVSVTIPSSVVKIDHMAFYGCYRLVEVINHSSLEIYAGASNYGDIARYARIVHDGESRIAYIDDYTFCVADSMTYLVRYTGEDDEILLPDGFNGNEYEILGYAFYNCTNIVSVEFSDSVTGVQNNAFANCSNIQRIKIGKNVKNGLLSAFSGCPSVNEIYLNSVTSFEGMSFGEDGFKLTIGKDVTAIPDRCFARTNIVSLDFESGSACETIGTDAFYGCYSLKTITIPENVTRMYTGAFCSCTRLETIYFNATEMRDMTSYTGDGNYAFYEAGQSSCGITVIVGKNVIKLPKYLFSPVIEYLPLYWQTPNIISLKFEENSACESINAAFCAVETLISVEIPENIKYNDNQFSDSRGIIEVINKSSLDIVKGSGLAASALDVHRGESKMIYDGDFIFYPTDDGIYLVGYTGSSSNLVLPEDYKGSSYKLFFSAVDRDKIYSIKISEGITSIEGCFSGFYNLSEVEIGSNVTSISYGAFEGAWNLNSVVFKDPNGWTAKITPIMKEDLSSEDLSDSIIAARYLSETYCHYYWSKNQA